MDAPGSYLSSPAILNCTKRNNHFSSLPPIPITRSAWIEAKWNENWREFLFPYLSGPFCGITWKAYLEIPAIFTSCLHFLLWLFFLSSSLTGKWEPFCFVASGFHVRMPAGQPQLMVRLSGQFISLGTCPLERYFTLSGILGDFSLIRRWAGFCNLSSLSLGISFQ